MTIAIVLIAVLAAVVLLSVGMGRAFHAMGRTPPETPDVWDEPFPYEGTMKLPDDIVRR